MTSTTPNYHIPHEFYELDANDFQRAVVGKNGGNYPNAIIERGVELPKRETATGFEFTDGNVFITATRALSLVHQRRAVAL